MIRDVVDVQDDLQGEEVVAKQEVAEKETFSVADPVTTASATTIVDELTLAHTLIEIKASKPKAVTIGATIITTDVASTRPKAKGIIFLYKAREGKMVEPKKLLKKKDQIALDEDLALRLQAEKQAELEKERVAHQEASREAIIEELDSIQAIIDVDEQLAAKLQAKEQEQFLIEEKLRMLKLEKDDQEEAEMKRHIEIVKDDEVAIDAIPLATKPPVIIEYKIDKMEDAVTLIDRADGSSTKGSSMIKMLQDI
ncbi:hypothetical protein Tco_0937036 [Tanacetum coccineum]|uniref:Uncharacterized protein n=1 Tax=Tanacetum coccineum TaxID=301880 RepID=A0ABQ5DFY3_9ASTR